MYVDDGYNANNKKNIFIFAVLLIIFIALIIIVFFIVKNNLSQNKNNNNEKIKNNVQLVLFGNEEITLNNEEEYEEPGYYAIDENGVVDRSNVIIEGNDFDNTKPGKYIIVYKYQDIIKTRTVNVLEENKSIDEKIYFELIDSDELTIEINEEYKEPGVIATIDDLNLDDLVSVDSNLDVTKAGEYEIIYTLIYDNYKKELKRTINVVDNNLYISLTTDKNTYTNSDISINVLVTGDNFSKLILPNNKEEDENTTTYLVSLNGSYTFKAYNESGKEFSETITIENIDKNKPTGTCTATINKINTNIIVDANDDNGISNYIYYDNKKEIEKNNNNNFLYNSKTSNDVSIKIIDVAKNETTITCNIIDNSYEKPIKPPENENITFKGETNTLNVYVSKYNSYYLTRIWMKDPYKQANKFDSPEYGKNLYKPSDLLSKANSNYNLKDKLLLGFNASGFYLKGTFDADSVKKYSKYDKTSVGTLVITNGKVIRNAYKYAVKTWFITGINKNNQMVVFEDKKTSSTYNTDAKKKWANEVINSGIKNTYTFAAPVIKNGKVTNTTTSMPGSNSSKKGLQMLCQINDNNFVLFTSSNETRNTAISKFLSLGCQTAVNLDGGGSIALIYKEKNSNTIKTVIGNNRKLTEVGYFSE